MLKKLSVIEELDLRTLFENEAGEFTPWLSENLEQLSDALGIEVVDPETESRVGDFRLDILGFDANTRQVVAVENQLEVSDHNHLGQLITYASGVEAGIVVWISPNLRPEHQQALTWLNENSDTLFFGVEVRAIRIGESDPAIDFRVRVAPNDWSRSIRGRTGRQDISPRMMLYREFYTELVDLYGGSKPKWRKIKAQPQSWLQFGAGKSGVYFGWAFRIENRFSVEVYIDSSEDPEQNSDYLNQLKSSIEIPSGLEDISWEFLPERRSCRIVLYRDGDINRVAPDHSLRSEMLAWGVEKMVLLENAFRIPIRNLKP